ncbi:unnamed protein product [Rhizophagus irregularis]|nr:unnamed protein product [Rhizophagus irregularis]
MKKCWDADPSKRPTSGEILNSVEECYRSSLNSKQTTNSSPTTSSSIKHEYITKEFELDININNIHQSSFTQSRSKNFSSSLSQLTSTVIANSLRKRNIEELKVDPQKNRKNIKTNS